MFKLFHLYSELPSSDKEIHEQIQALRHLTEAGDHQKLFDHLYGCLSILDAKSASLLTFNSIITAVYAIFMTNELHKAGWVLIHLGMLFILVSSLLLLSVVWVHWSTTGHLNDLNVHMVTLLTVRRDRTVKYRLAWNFSVTSLLVLTAFFVGRFVVHFP